jgi:hypothetical protein
MRKLLADEWSEVKRWWSVWVGLATLCALIALPILADRWTSDLMPLLVQYFPTSEKAIGPAIGVALTVLARITNQGFIYGLIRRWIARLLGRKEEDLGDG